MEEEIVKNVLISFMREMYKWEVEAHVKLDESKGYDDSEALFRKGYIIVKAIYNKYVTDRVRKYGSLNDEAEKVVSIGFPPEYNPDLETITGVEVKKNQASITTDRKYAMFESERIYKLKKVDGVWRIDAIKEIYKNEEKWSSISL